MPFDVNGALNAGYTPAEIANHLGEEKKFDVNAARKSGYTDDEIINHLAETAAPKKEEGVLGSLQKGAEQFGSTARTAYESIVGNPEEAALASQKRQEEIEQKHGRGISFEDIQDLYKEKGLGAAALQTVKQIPNAIAEQLPNLGATVASAGTGAALGSVIPGVGTILGGIAGAALPSFIQQYGGNIERQAEVQQSQNKPLDINRGKAALTAIPQTALDVAETFIPLGGKIAGKVFGPTVGKLLGAGEAAAAEKLASEALLTTLAKGTATGVLAEVPAEVTQQMLERAQAGLSLTDADALKEYGETAFNVSLLGPLGILGRVSNKAEARTKVLQAQEEAKKTNVPQDVQIETVDNQVQKFTVNPNGNITQGEGVLYGNQQGDVGKSPEEVQQAQFFKQQALEKQAELNRIITPEKIAGLGIGKSAAIFKDNAIINQSLSNPDVADAARAKLLEIQKIHSNEKTKNNINEFLGRPEFITPKYVDELLNPPLEMSKAEAKALDKQQFASIGSNGEIQVRYGDVVKQNGKPYVKYDGGGGRFLTDEVMVNPSPEQMESWLLSKEQDKVDKTPDDFKEYLAKRKINTNELSDLGMNDIPKNKKGSSIYKTFFSGQGESLDGITNDAISNGLITREDLLRHGKDEVEGMRELIYEALINNNRVPYSPKNFDAIQRSYDIDQRQNALSYKLNQPAELVSKEKPIEPIDTSIEELTSEEKAPIEAEASVKAAERFEGAPAAEPPLLSQEQKQPSKIIPEEQVLEKELSGKTMLELSDWSIKNAPNKFAKVIANMVNKRIKEMEKRGIKLEFNIASGNTRTSNMFNARGEVQFKFGKKGEETSSILTLNGAAVLDNQRGYPSGMNYTTILHELLHVATRGQLKLRSKNDPLVVELGNLRNEVVRYFNKRVDENNLTPFIERMYKREINALHDIDELVSWGLTDKNMQEFLSEIKVGNKTIFNKLVDLIRQILGISKDYETALDRLITTSEAILSEDIEVIAGRLEAAGYSFGTENPKSFTGIQESLFNKEQNKVSDAEMDKVHNAQRYGIGLDVVPEDMMHWKKNHGIKHSGKYQYAAEYIGDIVHRLSSTEENQGGGHKYGLGAAFTKATNRYDYKDMLAQVRRNAEAAVKDGEIKSVEAFEKEFKDAAKRYADAYKKIPVYTKFQELGRDAAIALGELNFPKVQKILNELSNELQKPDVEEKYFEKIQEPTEDVDILQSRMQADFSDVDPNYAEKIIKQFTQEKATVKQKFENLKANFFDKMVTGLFDEFRAIKEYSPTAYMQARLSKSIDGGLQGLLEHGQVYLRDGALDIRPNTKGLIQILSPLGKEVDRYQIWKALNRDANMPSNKRSFDANLVNGRNNLLTGTIDGKSRKEIYETALKQENELNKSVLDIAKQTGLIDQEAYNKFSNDIYYIPFYKVMEGGDVQSISQSSKLTGQYFSKALKGGEKKTNDLMENVLMNWSHILSAAMKNQAALSTIKSAKNLGVAEKATPMDGKYPPGSVKVMENGKVAHYTLEDPDLVDAISTISYLGPKSAFLDIAKGFTNVLRHGITLSPAYKVRNLIRDSIQSAAISELSPNMFSNVYNGLTMSRKGHPTFMSALAGGGIFEMGTAHEGNQAKLIKALINRGIKETSILDTPQKIASIFPELLRQYNELGNKFENANRLALYQKLIDSGKTHLEASYAARDLMDFSMQGQFRAVKVLGSVVPFFNARLQGLYKLGRDGISPTYRVICNATTGKPLEIGDKQKAMRFTVISSAVMLASMALYSMYKDDEDFQRREDWDRDNFWWFKIGSTQYRIPKPFEIGALGTIAERTLEQISDENVEGKVFFKRMNAILMDNFSMNPMPQMFKPLIDIYANKDSFTSAPIESAGMENLSKQERQDDKTSGIAKALGGISEGATKILTFNPDAQGLSPIQVDYMIKAYLGWAGATAVATADRAVEPFQEGTRVHPPVIDQLAMGFIKTEPETRSKYLTEFYQNNANLQSAMADMRHYAQLGDSEKVSQILEEKGNKIGLSKAYDKTTKEFAKIRKAIKIIENDNSIPEDDKRAEMNRLKILMSDIARDMESARKNLQD
jgi:hypothetical protein